MRDYAELVKALRHCNEIGGDGCFSCSHFARCEEVRKDIHSTIHCAIQADAADAIEELLAAVRSVIHCKDCEWWTKQEASIQGRCARLAIYPTGEFYCASGSKREPPKEDENDD